MKGSKMKRSNQKMDSQLIYRFCKVKLLFNTTLYYSPIQVLGSIRERPDIIIKPYTVNLKATSKLSFLAREDVEKVVLQNLEYLAPGKELVVNLPSLIQMARDIDINSTKVTYTEIYSKIILPQFIVDETGPEAYEGKQIPMYTIDITTK